MLIIAGFGLLVFLFILDMVLYDQCLILYGSKFGLSKWLASRERSIAKLPCGAIYLWARRSSEWHELPDHPDAEWLN